MSKTGYYWTPNTSIRSLIFEVRVRPACAWCVKHAQERTWAKSGISALRRSERLDDGNGQTVTGHIRKCKGMMQMYELDFSLCAAPLDSWCPIYREEKQSVRVPTPRRSERTGKRTER